MKVVKHKLDEPIVGKKRMKARVSFAGDQSPPSPPRRPSSPYQKVKVVPQDYEYQSPLLTPKEQESENEDFMCEETNEDEVDTLRSNPDYVGLVAALNMSLRARNETSRDILRLRQLQQRVATASPSDLIRIAEGIISNKLDIPKPRPVVAAPKVHWERYHPSLAKVGDVLKEGEREVYRGIKMWDD